MKLYHISTSVPESLLKNHEYKFEFRVPERRYEKEDSRYGRICASDSIEGALSAIPTLHYSTMKELALSAGMILVFEIDTDKLGIEEEMVHLPEYIYEEGLVDDALITGEHWISKTDGFTVGIEDIRVMHIADFKTMTRPVIPYKYNKVLGNRDIQKLPVWDIACLIEQQEQQREVKVDFARSLLEEYEFIETIEFSEAIKADGVQWTKFNGKSFTGRVHEIIEFLNDNKLDWEWIDKDQEQIKYISNTEMDLKLMDHIRINPEESY